MKTSQQPKRKHSVLGKPRGSSTFDDDYIKEQLAQFLVANGFIPPVADWQPLLGLQHQSSFSGYFKQRFPDVKSNRFKAYLDSLNPSWYVKVQRKGSTRGKGLSFEQQLQNLKRWFDSFIAEHGRTPYQTEWLKHHNDTPNPDFPRPSGAYEQYGGERTYEAFMKFLGYEASYPNNAHLDQRLRTLTDLPFTREYLIKINGRRYRLDYLIQHPEIPVLLEIDGTSHFTENSIYHQYKRFRKGATPEESFARKKQRDKTVNDFCHDNNLPLLRLDYHQFHRLTRDDFATMLHQTQQGKVHISTRAHAMRAIDQILQLKNEGLTDAEVAERLGWKRASISTYLYRHRMALRGNDAGRVADEVQLG